MGILGENDSIRFDFLSTNLLKVYFGLWVLRIGIKDKVMNFLEKRNGFFFFFLNMI